MSAGRATSNITSAPLRPRIRRDQGPFVSGRQSEPFGSGRPGRARQGARGHDRARRQGGRHRVADPAPRRRGVRGAGDYCRMLRIFGPSRLRHRRHDPFHHQQPDRLHHQPAICAFLALPVGHRQVGPGADPPRQRRRPRSGDLLLQAGDRIPPALQPRHRHRHVVLPPLRPQRGRRAELHPAVDVRRNPPA